MKDFHDKIEAILTYALKNRTLSPPIHTDMDLNVSHAQYKIDTMPEDKQDLELPLSHVSSLLSASGKEEPITRIKIYVDHDLHAYDYDKRCGRATLIATTKDGAKKIIHFNNFNEEIETQMKNLSSVKVSKAFERAEIGSINWGKKTRCYPTKYDKIYSRSGVVDDYKKIHQNIENEVVTLITKFLNERRDTHPIRLNLIDGGCGKSGLLKKLRETIAIKFPGKIELRDFGFDPVRENIEYMNSQDSGGHYVVGDLTASNSMVSTAQQKNWLFKNENETKESDKPVRTLMITSGVLTRLVLDMPNATRSLQSMCHSDIDAVISSGLNEATFSSNTTKRIGMKMTVLQSNERPVYLLEPLSLEVMCANKIAAFEKSKTSTLDLSLCSDPLYVLEHFKQEDKSKVTILDLSFCRPEDMDRDRLVNLLKAYPNLHAVVSYQSNEKDCNVIKFIVPHTVKLTTRVVSKTVMEGDAYDGYTSRTFNNEAFFMSKKALRRVYGLVRPEFGSPENADKDEKVIHALPLVK